MGVSTKITIIKTGKILLKNRSNNIQLTKLPPESLLLSLYISISDLESFLAVWLSYYLGQLTKKPASHHKSGKISRQGSFQFEASKMSFPKLTSLCHQFHSIAVPWLVED